MTYTTRVYASKVAAMSLPGGDIFDWTERITHEGEAIAVATCPVAKKSWGLFRVPGSMKAMHYSKVTVSPRGPTGTIGNRARYAKFVHQGTRTPITPTHSPYLKFTIDGRTFRKPQVSGQSAQPWLKEALDTIMRRHAS
jgi:hypothetical protein